MIYLNLFLEFLKIGCFSFGGAYSAIPLIRDSVLARGWLSEDMITYMIAVSESTPGPIMVNMATYIGNEKGGLLGAFIATIAVTLPAFIIIILVSTILKKALKNRYVVLAMDGLKPCVIGIIIATGIYMIFSNCVTLGAKISIDSRTVAMTALIATIFWGSRCVIKKGISPIVLIVISAVCGGIVYSI